MLTIEEIHDKADAMERRAKTAGEAKAAAYREITSQWRLLEVEAVFMEAMRGSIAPEPAPPPRSAST